MRSQLQPPNVSINKPFKHLIHRHHDDWLNKDNHILTPSGKIKSISTDNSGVDIKILERSASQYYSKIVFKVVFVSCGRWNANDILWDESEQSGVDASSSENETATEGSLDKLSD
jgi:hypothetical protein